MYSHAAPSATQPQDLPPLIRKQPTTTLASSVMMLVASGGGGGASYYNGVWKNTFLADETAAIYCPLSALAGARCRPASAGAPSPQRSGITAAAPQATRPSGSPASGASPTVGLVDVTAGSTTTRQSGTVPFGGMTAGAPTLQLNFRPQDVGSTSSTAASATDSSSDTKSSSSSSSPSLGGGAIAGIVVGIVVLLAAVGAALLFFILRRRRRRGDETKTDGHVLDGKDSSPASAANGGGYEKAELAGSGAQTHTELDTQQSQPHPFELEGSSAQPTHYVEMDSPDHPQELRQR
ncbi:hypothetical protein ISF_02927 [Cordyceps fumosorosea ARSEF 2679]|uniref:Uncharacterized protein n=1 Tax=Cordyceps fumosorosea (strain ARSEF 2679) TaxID=1081104 RepID=A0A168B5S3_CORFA|nr:hypothetical protein ISF_02927 [Cordyceps fumosorosea ARSEF 2679]OAA69657.1 hypothetical protein ISF_02927 [Cordyceps fumosorosea ARSEF 2679]